MWNNYIYEPLYNTFVFILGHSPYYSTGFAVIVFTILVKLLLFPLYQKSIYGQQILRTIDPKIKEIQQKYKDNREELGKKLMEVYKEYKINPLSSFFLILIQIPILIALYKVFSQGLINHSGTLYSFVKMPENPQNIFLGFVDMTKPFILFSVLAGITQHFQAKMSFPKTEVKTEAKVDSSKPLTFQEELAKNMRVQVIYILPLMIVFIGAVLPSAITLYWIVVNLFGIAQEKYVKSKIKIA
jgi:YidC/Oxa1 family membrane protein insertase